MYRKGVRDSAELFSPEMSKQFLDDNDPINDFVFLFDEDGRKLKFEFYCAMLDVPIKISARKGLILLSPGQKQQALRIGCCLFGKYVLPQRRKGRYRY